MYDDKCCKDKHGWDDYCYDEKDWCKKDDKCCKKPYVKIYVECGKECVCLCGILLGSYCKCHDKKVIVIKDKCCKRFSLILIKLHIGNSVMVGINN